jgi:hypothetical protein
VTLSASADLDIKINNLKNRSFLMALKSYVGTGVGVEGEATPLTDTDGGIT